MADYRSENEIRNEVLVCLRKNFNRSELTSNEWDIIWSLLSESHSGDNIVITQAGFDVSVCWQLPPVYLNKITVVVCSLKVGMRDQVQSAPNIRTCFLGQDQPLKAETFDAIRRGYYNVIHMTPEFITSWTGRSLLQEIRVGIMLIAIDGVHNIYSSATDKWRSAYGQLVSIRDELPDVPILAISPTVTTPCQDKITRSLRLNNPQITRMNIDRPNLEYIVEKGSQFHEIETNLKPYIKKISGPIVIFCITRDQAEYVAKQINKLEFGPICEYYHHGREQADRERIEDDFNNNRIRVIVTTNAFTLSREKNDVRMVVHYQRPKNLEDYYEHVGFAGRDGLPARCLMFYREEDSRKWRDVIDYFSRKDSISITNEEIETTLKPVADFASSSDCRRRFIMEYFEQRRGLPTRETCCDNCRIALNQARN